MRGDTAAGGHSPASRCFVSGHDFSRAEKAPKHLGLQPLTDAFEATSKCAVILPPAVTRPRRGVLCQGTTSVVPKRPQNTSGFSP